MILESIDFNDFYLYVQNIFLKHFTIEQVNKIMEFIEILADANFRCYRANMLVIAERKKVEVDVGLISDLEWVARNVGEYRVSSKARINKYISNVKSIKAITTAKNWITDDVVYSIGEMMDRLSIETIKREDFRVNQRPSHMTEASQKISNRVEKYLIQKLEEIDEKGFYECVHEQRTYDLEKIVKELAI